MTDSDSDSDTIRSYESDSEEELIFQQELISLEEKYKKKDNTPPREKVLNVVDEVKEELGDTMYVAICDALIGKKNRANNVFGEELSELRRKLEQVKQISDVLIDRLTSERAFFKIYADLYFEGAIKR